MNASALAQSPVAPSVAPGDQVFLIDATAFVFRAYFQSMNQDSKYNTRPSDGLPTGAVRLFCTKLLQFIREGAAGVKPTHLAVVFDKSGSAARQEIFAAYKGHRPDAPDDLKRQMPLMREAVRAFGLEPVEAEGFEADDLIATYSRQAAAQGACVVVISPDKDLMQLVEERVRFYDPESGDPKRDRAGYRPERNLDVDGVVERWGVPPGRIADALALVGDTSDNIPGVPGVGPKAAAALVGEMGSIEAILAFRERPDELDGALARRLAELQAEIDGLAGAPLKIGSGTQIAEVLASRFGVANIPNDKKGAPCADAEFIEGLAAAGGRAEEGPPLDPRAQQLARLILRARALSRATGATARKVLDNADQALLSKRLATLDERAPVPVPLDDLKLVQPDPKPLIAFFKAMELSTLARRIAQLHDIDPQAVEPDARLKAGSRSAAAPKGAEPAAGSEDAPTPLRLVAARAAEATRPFDPGAYETIGTVPRLREWVARAEDDGLLAVAALGTGPEPMRADLVGLALALAPGEACYLPLGHRGSDLFDGGGTSAGQISLREALEALRPLFESPAVLTVGHNLKYAEVLLARHGIALAAIDDVMLISYVLDAGKGGHGLEDLARRHLGYNPIALADVVGSGRQRVALDQVAPDKATPYAAQEADLVVRLWRLLKPRLPAEGRTSVYETLERPMVATLAAMERRGIRVDRDILSRLSGDFSQTLARLEHEIHGMAGEPFSLGSPKQIGDILFGKMGLPGAKKTPTGQWTTRATLLDELAELGHALPAKILDWRQLSKLKSTYTDALPTYMDPQTSRIHTSFSLAATTTGRLSSTEPNLQNIPIRTEEGRKIRTAFVAPPGHRIVSADYSQIELRLLAHIAEIPQLRQAFADGVDIHSATASAMFGVPLAALNPDLRRSAKTINFGIIYGISAFGLAQRLGIPQAEAAEFIKRYFERFPGIRDYMVETKEKCRKDGAVTTLFGRVCHYPQIRSANPQERAAVERQAINAPIQGSAADIIRRAMVRMDAALVAAGLKARMLLQVHDELVFEVPEEEVEATLPVVAEVMEEAPQPAVSLRVPLAVEARAGANWDEAH